MEDPGIVWCAAPIQLQNWKSSVAAANVARWWFCVLSPGRKSSSTGELLVQGHIFLRTASTQRAMKKECKGLSSCHHVGQLERTTFRAQCRVSWGLCWSSTAAQLLFLFNLVSLSALPQRMRLVLTTTLLAGWQFLLTNSQKVRAFSSGCQ